MTISRRFVWVAACAAALGLSACGGSSPFIAPYSADLETADPNTPNEAYLFDPGGWLTMNDVIYNPANDELIINNLPFDGLDGRYNFLRGQGAADSYRSIHTATTGQIDHFAVYMTADQIAATAAAGRDRVDFGYAGAALQRESNALPGGVGE